ncbi:MAG: hypothetical protein ABJP45_04795 [Cyclobacteriaceae bacterium]
MKNILVIVLLLFIVQARAQSPEALKKIEAAKIALITERLNLTPAQAEKFWPVYREYSNRNKEIRKDFDQARRSFDPNSATEEENKKMLEMATATKRSQLDLEQDYSQRFLQVVTSRQLNNLRTAEGDFKEMLLRRIKAQQMRKQQIKRNNDRLNNRRN